MGPNKQLHRSKFHIAGFNVRILKRSTMIAKSFIATAVSTAVLRSLLCQKEYMICNERCRFLSTAIIESWLRIMLFNTSASDISVSTPI